MHAFVQPQININFQMVYHYDHLYSCYRESETSSHTLEVKLDQRQVSQRDRMSVLDWIWQTSNYTYTPTHLGNVCSYHHDSSLSHAVSL